MTILVAVKKNGRVFLGADRITTFGNEYTTDLVNGSKIMKLRHAYLATSGYTLIDNIIEHLFKSNHKMMENPFRDRAEVFSFFLELYTELKKSYTLIDAGKDTYANMYNVFLLVTPYSIYGVSNNLSVHEYEKFAAKGAGSDYSQGALYGMYDLLEDGFEIARIALEAACHFSIYCKEPIDVIEVKANDFAKPPKGYKAHHHTLQTIKHRKGVLDFVAISREQHRLDGAKSNGSATGKRKSLSAAKTKRAAAASSTKPAPKAAASKTNKKAKKAPVARTARSVKAPAPKSKSSSARKGR